MLILRQIENASSLTLMTCSQIIKDNLLTTRDRCRPIWSAVNQLQHISCREYISFDSLHRFKQDLSRSWVVKTSVAGCTACLLVYTGYIYKIWKRLQVSWKDEVLDSDILPTRFEDTKPDHLQDTPQRSVLVPHGIYRNNIVFNLDNDSVQHVLNYYLLQNCSKSLEHDLINSVSEVLVPAAEIPNNPHLHGNTLALTRRSSSTVSEFPRLQNYQILELKLVEFHRNQIIEYKTLVVSLYLTFKHEIFLHVDARALPSSQFKRSSFHQWQIRILCLKLQGKSSAERHAIALRPSGREKDLGTQRQMVLMVFSASLTTQWQDHDVIQLKFQSYAPALTRETVPDVKIPALPRKVCCDLVLFLDTKGAVSALSLDRIQHIARQAVLGLSAYQQQNLKVKFDFNEGNGFASEQRQCREDCTNVKINHEYLFLSQVKPTFVAEATKQNVKELQNQDWIESEDENILSLLFEKVNRQNKTVKHEIRSYLDDALDEELHYDPEFSVPPGVAWADICPVDVPEVTNGVYEILSDEREHIKAEDFQNENIVFVVSCCQRPAERNYIHHPVFEESLQEPEICVFTDKRSSEISTSRSREEILEDDLSAEELQFDPEFCIPAGVSWADICLTDEVILDENVKEADHLSSTFPTQEGGAINILGDGFAIPIGSDWADICPEDVEDVLLEEPYQSLKGEEKITVWGLEVIPEEEEDDEVDVAVEDDSGVTGTIE